MTVNGRPEEMTHALCPHCERLKLSAAGTLNSKLYETDNVLVIAGDHQFFQGYCVVISKTHIREMHALPTDKAGAIFQDLMSVGRTIEKHFKPHKMNYVSLGNVDEHLHWHVMPRYLSDPDHKDHPWKNSGRFKDFPTSHQDILKLAAAFSR